MSTNHTFDVSVIVPVYNEVSTIRPLFSILNSFCNKSKYSIEVIIVESGSTDGTRELIESLRLEMGYPWKFFNQAVAEGKGSACRLGILNSTGRVISIFDGDLEYDIFDLNKLVDALDSTGEVFVLGSRHSVGPMRVFDKRAWRAKYYNLGHHIFTILFNFLYNTSLRDPATMWKVFGGHVGRSVEFNSNKFDFDWEVLAKLIRLGNVPREIPISYKSRSPEEGKKIRPFRDPLHWLWRILIFRFVPLKRNQIN